MICQCRNGCAIRCGMRWHQRRGCLSACTSWVVRSELGASCSSYSFKTVQSCRFSTYRVLLDAASWPKHGAVAICLSRCFQQSKQVLQPSQACAALTAAHQGLALPPPTATAIQATLPGPSHAQSTSHRQSSAWHRSGHLPADGAAHHAQPDLLACQEVSHHTPQPGSIASEHIGAHQVRHRQGVLV
jgi:hypothetical protein